MFVILNGIRTYVEVTEVPVGTYPEIHILWYVNNSIIMITLYPTLGVLFRVYFM